MDVADKPEENLKQHFDDVGRFINSGKKLGYVLVHW